MKLTTVILALFLVSASMFAQGVQPDYPVGATMTTWQYEMNWCSAQHWTSTVGTDDRLRIEFTGKWTAEQKIELVERCSQFMRDGLNIGGTATSVTSSSSLVSLVSNNALPSPLIWGYAGISRGLIDLAKRGME